MGLEKQVINLGLFTTSTNIQQTKCFTIFSDSKTHQKRPTSGEGVFHVALGIEGPVNISPKDVAIASFPWRFMALPLVPSSFGIGPWELALFDSGCQFA